MLVNNFFYLFFHVAQVLLQQHVLLYQLLGVESTFSVNKTFFFIKGERLYFLAKIYFKKHKKNELNILILFFYT